MTPLTKHDIGRLLPHGEAMCLLDSVEAWDDVSISCRTWTHRDPRNPLRFRGCLTVAAGLEYAAQAMGAHVGLVRGGRKSDERIGLVGGVRNVMFAVDRLDHFEGPLLITAAQLVEGDQGFMYAFTVAHEALTLIEGRASIFVRAAV